MSIVEKSDNVKKIPDAAFVGRIQLLVDVAGGQNALARLTGISQGVIQQCLKGSEPTRPTLIRLASGAKVSVEWLATGAGPMHFINLNTDTQGEAFATPEKSLAVARIATVPDGMVAIPLLAAVASAGDGAVVLGEETIDFIHFNEAWLRENYRVNPRMLALLPTVGESMEPTIRAGEMVLVDRSATRPTDGIYVVRLEGDLLVKRLQRLPGNQIEVSSDNPLYKSFTVHLDDGIDFAIIGRVVIALSLRHL